MFLPSRSTIFHALSEGVTFTVVIEIDFISFISTMDHNFRLLRMSVNQAMLNNFLHLVYQHGVVHR